MLLPVVELQNGVTKIWKIWFVFSLYYTYRQANLQLAVHAENSEHSKTIDNIMT